LDKERGLALLAGRLLLVLQDLRSEGRNIRAYQREEPDDLHQARQELEALLSQIQPEPYKFYERWRQLPEQVRLKPEGCASSSSRTVTTPPTPRPTRPFTPSPGMRRCCAWEKCRWNCKPARR
jgi:hypothetical protein